MPSLKTEVASYVKRVIDSLRTGPGYASASLSLGSGTSEIKLMAVDPGVKGNEITVEITAPSGTSDLAVTAVGKAITIALAVANDVPVDVSNTAALVCAAINASAPASALVEASLTGSGAGSFTAAAAAQPLTGGVDGTQSQPLNFLRAQDMATVLELLQDALGTPAALTATGGTATSVQDTGAFVADTQVGNLVTFTGNTTAELAGVTARVVSNTVNALFFAPGALPKAPAAGDTYKIAGGLADVAISELRSGRGLADAPAANVYGDSRIVTNALVMMVRQLGKTVADKTMWAGLTAAGSSASEIQLNTNGGELRIDELKNLKISVTGLGDRKILSNTADGRCKLSAAYASAPTSGVAVAISVPQDSTEPTRNYTFAPGGQPGDNKLLAQLMTEAKKAVVAFTLPA